MLQKELSRSSDEGMKNIGASNADQIRRALRATAPVKLNKSYRSTWEIMQFALSILPNEDLIPMKRHGESPQIVVCSKMANTVAKIISEIESFHTSSHQSMAIIVKKLKDAKHLHQQLLKLGVETNLIDADSTGFSSGIILCTIHLAKGLEFDHVIVPDANAES
ncbi:MAG: hypothetical protein HQL68_11315 [Magnetococcales bacterium]|nr:hypothetical protein [Magnetococcales bacterium]